MKMKEYVMHYQFINDAESCIFATCALASEWDAKHCRKQTFQSCFKPTQWTIIVKGQLRNSKTENMFVCVKTFRTPDRHLKLIKKSVWNKL